MYRKVGDLGKLNLSVNQMSIVFAASYSRKQHSDPGQGQASALRQTVIGISAAVGAQGHRPANVSAPLISKSVIQGGMLLVASRESFIAIKLVFTTPPRSVA